jgi:hypothetical protein
MNSQHVSTPMAWALLILVMLAGYVAIASPLVMLHEERRARIDLLGETIADRMVLIARGQALADRREALIQSGDGRLGIIPARDTTAVARLQEHLRLVATDQGLRVDTLRVLADRARPPLREVAVRASLSGSVGQVQRLLHGLETGTPMVRVSNIDVLGRPGTPGLEISLEIAALAESDANAD